jgi:hypothetical protein
MALTPRGKLSIRDKLIALIAGQVKEEEFFRREGQSMPGRAVKLAFLARLFGGGDTRVIALNSTASKDDKPKTFWDRLNAGSLLPILGSMMLAAAAWKTGETISWKSASDAARQTVDVVKEQLKIANQDKKDLQAKNDDVQQDMRDFLTKALGDSKADVKTLSDGISNLLTKYKPPKPQSANTSSSGRKSDSN